jgi:hypothetical protein
MAPYLRRLDDQRDRRVLLADGHVKALYAGFLLIDDRVDGDRGLARLAVADDQFALTAPDGRHGVDRLDAGLQRLVNRLPFGDAGGDDFHRPLLGRFDGPLTIQRVAQRVEHAADDAVAHRDAQQLAQRLDFVAFVDRQVVTQDDDTDAVLFQIESQPMTPLGTGPSRRP